LVPPHCHRRNAAERAIRTFKEHFVAGLSSVHPTFLLHLWDRLLPQVEITLNLLRTSRLHPQLSAAAHFHGLDYNKTAFSPPGCKIVAQNYALGHPTGNMDIHWAQQCITTDVKMYTSLLQLVNASWTHSSSSHTIIKCRLILTAKDMTDALQNPRPEVPFAHVGDDTISTLAKLATIFKHNLQQPPPPTLPAAPPTVKQRTCLAESSNPILASPIPPPRRARSQTKIHAQDITNAPLLPRVVIPMTRNPSPPRVPTRSRNLSPRNLSQKDFCSMDTAHMAIALGNNHWSKQHLANAVIHPVTGKEMEYMALMKDPRLQPL
jgi:hypothetical protein